MKKLVNGQYIELTPEEIAAMQKEQERDAARERKRPLTEVEVTRMLLAEQINTLSVDDVTALRMREYYPEWHSGKDYAVGYKVQHNGDLYKVLTAHTSQADWTPDVAPTLFVRIDEVHDGSEFDPIPYAGNMALTEGMYYTQDGGVYICTRSTVNPVYAALSELVGLYVERGVNE